MSLVGPKEAWEVVYLDRRGLWIGVNSLTATSSLDAGREAARKIMTAIENRATRSDKFVRGGYFRKVGE